MGKAIRVEYRIAFGILFSFIAATIFLIAQG
jgi:hypothetical protein